MFSHKVSFMLSIRNVFCSGKELGYIFIYIHSSWSFCIYQKFFHTFMLLVSTVIFVIQITEL